MISALISRVVILVFGTLYPAYSSYKAVKTKNVKEYVKWMMYWIVFALFTTVETFADVLIAWFPFYYELKIAFVIWLLSPATKGASLLYRKFVHPELMKREEEIDQTIAKVKTQGYTALVNAGQQGLNIAVQGAMTGQARVFEQVMKKSWSVGDLSQQSNTAPVTYIPQPAIQETHDETDFPAAQKVAQQSNLQTNPESTSQWTAETEVRELDGGAFHQPVIGDHRSHSGYNLRSHEYHSSTAHSQQLDEMMTDTHSSQPYHSNVGTHYGTLPRRAASMRSCVNTALPSRWSNKNISNRKSNIQ